MLGSTWSMFYSESTKKRKTLVLCSQLKVIEKEKRDHKREKFTLLLVPTLSVYRSVRPGGPVC